MFVEISIAKEKAKDMPKGAIDALKRELERTLCIRFPDVKLNVKTASNDGLSVLRAADKDGDRKVVEQILQNTWESADEWFMN